MSYEVVFSIEARRELASAFRYRAERAPMSAHAWHRRLTATVYALSEYPERWPLAPEARRWNRPIRLRLFGKKRQRFRILFQVEGNTVVILHIRWGARALMLGRTPP